MAYFPAVGGYHLCNLKHLCKEIPLNHVPILQSPEFCMQLLLHTSTPSVLADDVCDIPPLHNTYQRTLYYILFCTGVCILQSWMK